MRSVIVVLTLLLAATVAQAEGTYFSWVTEDGVFAFAGEAKGVPAKYKDAAKEIPFPTLAEYEKFTPTAKGSTEEHATALTARLERLRSVAVASRPAEKDCGTVSLRSERRTVEGGAGGDGTFNTRFYIAEDDCGVLFDAPFYPDFQVNR